MREGVRYTRVSMGFAALAALFVGAGHASAQDSRTYVERQGFRQFQTQDTGGTDGGLLRTPSNWAFAQTENTGTTNLTGTPSVENRLAGAQSTDDEIVVTARVEALIIPHDGLERSSFLGAAGITAIENEDRAGLGPYETHRPGEETAGISGAYIDLFNQPDSRFSFGARVVGGGSGFGGKFRF